MKSKSAVSGLVVLALIMAVAARSAWCEGEDTRAQDQKFKADRDAAERRVTDTASMTPEQKADWKKKEQDRKDKEDKVRNLADYKQNTLNNLAAIKEMFAKAEAAYKEKQYRPAASFYESIVLATVPGAETMVDSSRNRLVELEDLAKKLMNDSADSDLKQDFVKEVEQLSTLLRDFPTTKCKETALRKLINLKSRPEVAAYVDLAQAEGLEADGKLTDAINAYKSISANPRYEHSVAALKASRKLDDLNKNEETRAKIKSEMDAKADKEAKPMMDLAKNYLANNKPKMAIEKLQQVIEKFPDTQYAEQAKKQIEELKEYK